MLNLPNALAMLRVFLAPLMLFLLLQHRENTDLVWASWLNYFAALVFTVAAVTDFFDGFIARALNQQTKLGAIIDPLADKMLILAAFLGLALIDRANIWAVYLILVREFFITGFRVFLAAQNVSVAAGFSGKVKTTFQLVAIGFLTMQWSGGEVLLFVALFLTLYSGAEYVIAYAKNKEIKGAKW